MKLRWDAKPSRLVCDDSSHLHASAACCSRRSFLGGLAAAALAPAMPALAQAPAEKPFRIDTHHHLSSPGFIAEITGRRTGQIPLMRLDRGEVDRGHGQRRGCDRDPLDQASPACSSAISTRRVRSPASATTSAPR